MLDKGWVLRRKKKKKAQRMWVLKKREEDRNVKHGNQRWPLIKAIVEYQISQFGTRRNTCVCAARITYENVSRIIIVNSRQFEITLSTFQHYNEQRNWNHTIELYTAMNLNLLQIQQSNMLKYQQLNDRKTVR